MPGAKLCRAASPEARSMSEFRTFKATGVKIPDYPCSPTILSQRNPGPVALTAHDSAELKVGWQRVVGIRVYPPLTE